MGSPNPSAVPQHSWQCAIIVPSPAASCCILFVNFWGYAWYAMVCLKPVRCTMVNLSCWASRKPLQNTLGRKCCWAASRPVVREELVLPINFWEGLLALAMQPWTGRAGIPSSCWCQLGKSRWEMWWMWIWGCGLCRWLHSPICMATGLQWWRFWTYLLPDFFVGHQFFFPFFFVNTERLSCESKQHLNAMLLTEVPGWCKPCTSAYPTAWVVAACRAPWNWPMAGRSWCCTRRGHRVERIRRAGGMRNGRCSHWCCPPSPAAWISASKPPGSFLMFFVFLVMYNTDNNPFSLTLNPPLPLIINTAGSFYY